LITNLTETKQDWGKKEGTKRASGTGSNRVREKGNPVRLRNQGAKTSRGEVNDGQDVRRAVKLPRKQLCWVGGPAANKRKGAVILKEIFEKGWKKTQN